MMKRRQFLTGGAIGAAGLAAGCDCGDVAAIDAASGAASSARGIRERELKMVTTWPKDFPGLGTMAERVAKTVTEASGGAMRVTIYAANELVPALQAFDAVSNGAADMYHGAEYYWVGKSKAYSFFTAVPFGMTASEIMAWTEFGGGHPLWDELSAQFNVKPFAAGNSGHQLGGWFKEPINSLSDLQGRIIRMPGIGGEVIRRVGATPVTLPGGEIYQALQTGRIDGTEWVGPWNDLAFGFYREAKYYYWPGFHEPGAQLATGVNLDLWNELTLQEKSIIRAACHQANHLAIAEYGHFNALALRQLVDEHGVELRQMPADVMKALAEASREVLDEFERGDDLSRRIFESYRDSLRRSQEWGRIADEAFMSTRRAVFSL
ncbi:MAG: TRAP transporter substrate-binding protein [Pseudomonadota bacterium]